MMNRDLLRFCVFSLAAVFSWQCEAVEVHRYTFNDGTVNDSVGSADGTLMGNANIGGVGLLNLLGGGAGNSYAELPSGIASAASSSGVSGEITTETWVNVNSNSNWAVIFSFGNSGPDAMDNNGSDGDYWQLIPQSGSTTLRTTTHIDGAETLADAANGLPLTTGSMQHVVNVLNVTADTNELYVNGTLVASTTLQTDFDPSTYGSTGDTQNWLGRSQWGDPSLNGSYDEFRIYDHALTAAEVTSSFAIGATPPPVIPFSPVLTVDRSDGTLSLQGGQDALQVVGYVIESEFGSLNQAGWTPITDNLDAPSPGNGSFDNNDQWSILTAAGSHTDLSEFELDGGDGGQLGIGAFMDLGGMGTWIQSPNDDLTMKLKLDDGSTVLVSIVYENGNDGQAFERSDLNFDGEIDGLDWPIFRDNAQVDMSALSLAQAYGQGDLDGDGDNDYADFQIFRADFNAAAGSENAFELMVASVPEPSSAVLLVGLMTSCWAAQRRRRSLVATRCS